MEENKVFDWDDIIDDDGEQNQKDWVLLPEGDFDFEVYEVEKSWYNGSDKMPACPMAILTLNFKHPDDGMNCRVWDRFFLCGKMEWKLSSFFRSIGEKEHGSKVKMDWDSVEGKTGRAHVIRTQYNGKDKNEIKFYIDKPEQTRTLKAGEF